MSNPLIVNRDEHDASPSEGHLVVWPCFKEFVRDGQGRLTSVILWTDSGKTQKIRESTFNRDVQHRVTSIVKKTYGATGTLKATITMAVTRPVNTITGITVSRA